MWGHSCGLWAASVFLTSAIASAVPQVVPASVPVTVIHREVGEPKGVDKEGAPVENVTAYAPAGTLHLPIAPQDREKLGLRVQPILEVGENKIELPWMNASYIADYMNRIPTQNSVMTVQMEDGTWARGTNLGLHVDLMTDKIYVPFRVWELERSTHNVGNPETTVIEIPVEQLSDKVFSQPVRLKLPEKWRDQQYFISHTGYRKIRVVVLAFEGATSNQHAKGPLAPYIPGYKNKDHSAIVVMENELCDVANPEIGIYRVPVSLLRTMSKVDLEGEVSQPDPATAALWLSVMKLASFRFDGQQQSAEERHTELQKQTQKEFAVSNEFDLAPESCTTLIARKADAA